MHPEKCRPVAGILYKLLLAPCKQLLRRVFNSELIANSYLHWDTHSPSVIPNCLISDAERTVFIKNRLRITVKDRKYTAPFIIRRANHPSPFPVSSQRDMAENWFSSIRSILKMFLEQSLQSMG